MKNSRVSRKKENVKIRADINEKETKETIAKISKTKTWFFVKKIKQTNHQPDSPRKKKKKNQINYIRNENGEITTHNTEIQRVIRDYYQQLYAN